MYTTDQRRQTGASILDLIGNTPLLRLRRFESAFPRVEFHAKAEWMNPGGSVKDRAAARILAEGERVGRLTPARIILDSTSGNTGIAYGMIAAARGYRVTLCVPANVTPERTRILRAYGVELRLTDALEGSDGAIREARRLYASDPERYFYADQYSNDANWRAHYDTTGPEIIQQTEGRLTHFIAGLGTSGTFMGAGRRLREHNPKIRLVSVQPDSPLHGLEGLKHMESAIVPAIYDLRFADEDLRVSTEEAYECTRRLASEEGLLVGISSGAALAAGLRVASSIDQGVIVMIFCDSGERYLSQRFWEETDDATTGPPARRRDSAAASHHAAKMAAGMERVPGEKQPEPLTFGPAIATRICDHARDTYPYECCGALIGTGSFVSHVEPLPNATEEGPRRRFLVRPDDYRLAEFKAATLGGELLGFYHSHPDAPARPSRYDLDHAWPTLYYVIVSVLNRAPAETTCWRLKEDRSMFEEIPVWQTE